jgi:hypothetical protein
LQGTTGQLIANAESLFTLQEFLMRRKIATAIVRACLVVQVLIAASVANAQTKKVAGVGGNITAPATGWCSALGMKMGTAYIRAAATASTPRR